MATTVLEDVERLLSRMAQALGAANVGVLSDCWGVPAAVLSDEGVLPIADKKQIEHLERLSVNLAAVDVAWPSFEASGKEIGSEISHYIPLLDKDEQWRIRVALTRVLDISL